MNTRLIVLFPRIFPSYRIKLIIRCFFLSCLLGLNACATVPRERVFDDFVIVKAEAVDDFSSLAANYLNNPEKAWQIAEFNNIASVKPGQELVIPLSPFNRGGLKADGCQTVPILTYYGFSRNKTGELIVSEGAFNEQMKYLKENGYDVITLDQLLDFLDFKSQIPKKSVVITFDDGWRSLYDIAFPVLKRNGFPATLFIYTDFIGGTKALSWEQVDELAKNGFDVQSKTMTHRDLTKLNKGESFKEYFKTVQRELSQSKKIIEKQLGRKCKYMAYPYGVTNNLATALVKKEGYRAAFTIKRGSNPFYVDNYRINRSVIHGSDNMEQFKDNLSVFSRSELR
ncbi:MAG: polysaccharide deacetylase family protein [Deltaproteobacteria bacterium]|nr:polysaccharide deacetylase family protein [Deltaproteobacteria bacterium]